MVSTNVTYLSWTQPSAHEAYKALLIKAGLKPCLGAYRNGNFAYFPSFFGLILVENGYKPWKGDFLIVNWLQRADSNLSEGMLLSARSCLALSMADFSMFLVLLVTFLS
jgi:hypothetical protein